MHKIKRAAESKELNKKVQISAADVTVSSKIARPTVFASRSDNFVIARFHGETAAINYQVGGEGASLLSSLECIKPAKVPGEFEIDLPLLFSSGKLFRRVAFRVRTCK